MRRAKDSMRPTWPRGCCTVQWSWSWRELIRGRGKAEPVPGTSLLDPFWGAHCRRRAASPRGAPAWMRLASLSLSGVFRCSHLGLLFVVETIQLPSALRPFVSAPPPGNFSLQPLPSGGSFSFWPQTRGPSQERSS